ncbi:MAG: BspA family leucine-rich repeat surface protein [Bacteroidetes bacterium]|nr:BspA family leucine-rich repeat surface protein [Bacteroidota bacterium]
MKPIFIVLLFFFQMDTVLAQDFITHWNLSMPGALPTSLTFGVGTSGTVNYTWETIPAGMNGAGTFTGNTATIAGLPAGALIRLKISPPNFNRIIINFGADKSRLVDIEQWGTIEWLSMAFAFYGCNQLNITASDVPDLSQVTSMESMFRNCSILNSPSNINSWNTSSIQDMTRVFNNATVFNQPVGNWNTSNVTSMYMMFAYDNQFNQPVGNWNTSNVTVMYGLFTADTAFNQPIGNWNTSNVTTMHSIFAYAYAFNQPIGNWNTASVVKMNYMFQRATAFNQPIGNWNTSSVNDMSGLFAGATSFNQPLSNWNTSLGPDMQSMFNDATSFNQPIGNWNTSNVINMYHMFKNATSFNQPLGTWDISNITYYIMEMLSFCGMDCANYSATLAGWSANPNIQTGLNLGANNLQYGLNVQNERNYLTITKGWTISGDAPNNTICCFPKHYTITDTACFLYTHNGQTYLESGLFHDTFTTVYGCDSIINLQLTIIHPNTTVTQLGTQLSSNASGATYQWITCPTNIPIPGETNQSFTATINGDYVVIVTENACVDTSDCSTVSTVGIAEFHETNPNSLLVYPNPVSKILYVKMSGAMNDGIDLQKDIYNSVGQLIFRTTKNEIDISAYPKGLYSLKCQSFVVKIMVQ